MNTASKAPIPPADHPLERFPAELTALSQWVVWKEEKRKGKLTKVPYNARTGAKASSSDPTSWSDFPTAIAPLSARDGGYRGVGFVFSEKDPYTGVDLDKCRNAETGEIDTWALDITNELDSYTEISPSGTGLHVFIRGQIPEGARKKKACHGGAVEMYSSGRYFTVTGKHLSGTPLTVEDRADQLTGLHARVFPGKGTGHIPNPAPPTVGKLSDEKILDLATRARNGSRFTQLMRGDTSGNGGDDSAADLALCNILAFYTQDPDQIDRMFRLSGLMRDKWNREDYRGATIQRAINGQRAAYKNGAGRVMTDSNGWKRELIRAPGKNGELGRVTSCLANAAAALRHAPDWDGVLWFDEFAFRVVARRQKPWGDTSEKWGDNDDRRATEWMQHQDIPVNVELTGAAIQMVADEHRYHPVREYLESLKWDGRRRIDTWLRDYLNAADPDQPGYLAAVGPKFLISAVARIYEPGAKVDSVLVLEGPQGCGKSAALKILAGPWFDEYLDLEDPGSKDGSMLVSGKWIVELAELDAMRKAEVSRIKAWITRTHERFRPPYGKHTAEFPRQCVFTGTTNADTWMNDETGGRRFWPVKVKPSLMRTTVELQQLSDDRDQIWAESVVRYKTGEPYYLDSAALIEIQRQVAADRYQPDPWQPKIVAYLAERDWVTLSELLDRLDKPHGQRTQADDNRVVKVLTTLNWERWRRRCPPGDILQWGYRPKGQ